MLCVIHNHNYINEVQTMVQVFFGTAKIQYNPPVRPETGYVIESFLAHNAASAAVYRDGELTGDFSWPLSEMNEYLNERRLIMLCLYHALQRAVEADTPWGALTGIRPSKLVREWMDAGRGEDEIIRTLTDTFCCKETKAWLALTVAHAEKKLTGRIFADSPSAVGIYVSIPFCPTRCVYCSFNTSHKPARVDLQERYSAALIGECFEKAQRLHDMGAAVSSIYIGGGTPTVLPEYLLERVLDAIGTAFNSGADSIEYTVEAGRPDTLTPEKLKLLRRYGVNRIAVNPQTLNDRTLAAIGRGHTAADFFTAFQMAREAGFTCINTDLIAGLPNETPDDMRCNMEELAKLAPENITIHTLAIKRASKLNEIQKFQKCQSDGSSGNNPVFMPPQKPLAKTSNVQAMLDIAEENCAKMGLSPYYLYRQKNMVGLLENVGYSQPGHECLYNIGMMAEVQTILGIGAGAVSKLVIGSKITREFNAKNPEIYIERRKEVQV